MSEGRLFLLQVWTDTDRFSAALRAVDETHVIRFDAARDLCDHVARIAHQAPLLPQSDAGTALAGTAGVLATPSDSINQGGRS